MAELFKCSLVRDSSHAPSKLPLPRVGLNHLICTPLMSGAVFSHALCKTSLSSFKSLFPLSRFLSTAAPPWGAAAPALEQTSTQLTEHPGIHSACQKCTAKASSRVIPLGRQRTCLYSYASDLHSVWEMGSTTMFFFLATRILLPAWVL